MNNKRGYESLNIKERFAKTLVNLRYLRPFYSAIYETLEKIVDESAETMGVTTTQLVYNPEFVMGLEFNEFMFIQLHEIAHVALMHVSRRKKREKLLWNIACDLYANKTLAVEFDIKPGQTDSTGLVKMQSKVCYVDTLDLNTEYTEQIYNNLYDQAKTNGYSKFVNATSIEDLDDLPEYFEFKYTGSAEPEHTEWDTFSIKINPKVSYYCDIDDKGKDDAEAENDNKRIMNSAITKYDMQNVNSSGKTAGSGAGTLESMVREALKSHIDWRKLLKKYCIKATSHDTSYARPDKRMYYQRAIYPGLSDFDANKIQGLKICWDKSGSISDEEIAYFYGQVIGIIKQFKIDAEMLSWDTEVHGCDTLTSILDLKKVKLVGGGGTDPSCIFNYFDSKQCKIKPIVTVVFTDGYFYTQEFNPRWKRKYKDTIWVMSKEHNQEFKPPFGVKTVAKYSEG